MGCLKCRENPGKCNQKDDLSPFLEEMKSLETGGIVVGSPIYMFRITGQMKLFVDRIYSLYKGSPAEGYSSMIPSGKTYSLVISQSTTNPSQYEKSIRYLAGMTGSGLGMEIVGEIIHVNSSERPAIGDEALLEKAYEIGRMMIRDPQRS